MYTTMRLYKLDESYDKPEIARKVRDVLLPQLREVPGFIDYYRFEAEDETIVTVGVYRDEESAKRASDIVARFNKSIRSDVKLIGFYEGPIDVSSRGLAPV